MSSKNLPSEYSLSLWAQTVYKDLDSSYISYHPITTLFSMVLFSTYTYNLSILP